MVELAEHQHGEPAYRIPPDTLPRRYTWLGQWRDVLAVVRALEGLVSARLPLSEGLLVLSQDAPNQRLSYMFYWLHRDLGGGLTLSEAMGNRSDFFPPYCIDLVEAGEASGNLAGTLSDLEQELDGRLDLRRRVAGHAGILFYSCVPALVVVVVTMLAVLPQFRDFALAADGAPAPALELVLRANTAGVPLLILIVIVAIPAMWFAAEYSALRGGALAAALGNGARLLPPIGGIGRKRHLALAAGVLGRLLAAGTPLPRALRSAGAATGAARVLGLFGRMADGVEGGATLQEVMAKEGRALPVSFRRIVALGEQGGRLPEALEQVAASYRVDCQRGARLCLEIGFPLSVCVVGAVVFLVYRSVFDTLAQMLLQVQ